MAARKSKTASSRSVSGKNGKASGNARSTKSASSARGSGSRNGAMRQSELDSAKLIEFLSQMLAVEKGGVMLYEKALNELSDQDLREDLEEFLEQTHRHVELCEEMLEQAGGSPDDSSPAADAAQEKAEGLISVEVPEEMTDFNNIENLVLAETKDNWNWEMLAEISKSIKDRELRSAIGRAVKEVEKQERRHVDWNRETLSELGREMLSGQGGEEQTDEEGMEEEA
jgi:rubrerythrin